jgi:hypothetical protein
LQRNIQRIHSFNKTASSIDDILNPGPEPLPHLHGVPFLARDPTTSLIFEIWAMV